MQLLKVIPKDDGMYFSVGRGFISQCYALGALYRVNPHFTVGDMSYTRLIPLFGEQGMISDMGWRGGGTVSRREKMENNATQS